MQEIRNVHKPQHTHTLPSGGFASHSAQVQLHLLFGFSAKFLRISAQCSSTFSASAEPSDWLILKSKNPPIHLDNPHISSVTKWHIFKKYNFWKYSYWQRWLPHRNVQLKLLWCLLRIDTDCLLDSSAGQTTLLFTFGHGHRVLNNLSDVQMFKYHLLFYSILPTYVWKYLVISLKLVIPPAVLLCSVFYDH